VIALATPLFLWLAWNTTVFRQALDPGRAVRRGRRITAAFDAGCSPAQRPSQRG
jgi:hypothetical protein